MPCLCNGSFSQSGSLSLTTAGRLEMNRRQVTPLNFADSFFAMLATISWRRNTYVVNVQIRIVYIGTRRWKGNVGGTYDFRREGRGRKAQCCGMRGG